MTIYIDISAAVHHRAGLGRYAENLVRAMVPLLDDDLALFYNREGGIDPLPGLAHLPEATVGLGYKPWRMAIALGQLARLPFNKLVPGAKLFHATEHLLLPLWHVPTVLTVHDLIFRKLPEHHKALNRWYLNATMPLTCKRASHIIAISQATKHDIIEAYGIPDEKITVIYEAAAPSFTPQPPVRLEAVRAHYHLPDAYLLFVGTIEPRKNLTRLLHAWEPLYAQREAPPLVIVGKTGWLTGDFFAALEQSPAKDGVILPGYVAEQDLPAVYGAATALVMPSLYEGFGLPPLEAMACGTPVLCSDSSSLPEVVGDAAVQFDPRDEHDMARAIRTVVADADLRQQLAQLGLAQAARFSWEKTAKQTLAVYRKLLEA